MEKPLNNKVPGGATIWARQTIESELFFYKPDKWFKMWFYIVNKVSHKDTKLFKRGEGLIRYEDIARDCKATKKQVERFVSWLHSRGKMESRKTTRGMRRIVLNYDKYQSLENYKATEEGTAKGTGRGVGGELEGVSIYKNEKNEKNIYTEFKEFVREYEALFKVKLKANPKKRFAKYKARRRSFSPEEILQAMKTILRDSFLQGDNPSGKRYGDIDYILRDDEKIEKWIAGTTKKPKSIDDIKRADFETKEEYEKACLQFLKQN